MRPRVCLLALAAAELLWVSAAVAQTITVSFPASRSDRPVDGRLLLLALERPKRRAAYADRRHAEVADGFRRNGRRMEARRARSPSATMHRAIRGASLKDVPPGDYTVQAVLNVYETFHRSDGKTVKLAPDRGEGQHWNLAPGNLLSKPRLVRIGPGAPPIEVSLDEVIPPIEPEPDTKYIRHIRIQSKLLTKFWGRPVVSVGGGSCAGGLRRSSAGALSADRLPRPLRNRLQRLPRNSAGPESKARLLRPLSPRRLQPHSTGGGVQELPSMDCARNAAHVDREAAACESLLRRLVCGELGKSRPIWRRDRDRADPGDRAAVSRHRPRLGAIRLWRLDRRLGIPRRADVLSRCTTTARSSPVPTRSTSTPT